MGSTPNSLRRSERISLNFVFTVPNAMSSFWAMSLIFHASRYTIPQFDAPAVEGDKLLLSRLLVIGHLENG